MLLVPCRKPAPICGWEGKRTQRHLHLKMKKERKTFIVGNKLQKSQCLSANANANHILIFANLSLTRPHCNNWTGPVLDKRCVLRMLGLIGKDDENHLDNVKEQNRPVSGCG